MDLRYQFENQPSLDLHQDSLIDRMLLLPYLRVEPLTEIHQQNYFDSKPSMIHSFAICGINGSLNLEQCFFIRPTCSTKK